MADVKAIVKSATKTVASNTSKSAKQVGNATASAVGIDKSLFFLIVSLGSFWLVLDEFFGKKYIDTALTTLISGSDSEIPHEDAENINNNLQDNTSNNTEHIEFTEKPAENTGSNKTDSSVPHINASDIGIGVTDNTANNTEHIDFTVQGARQGYTN